MKIFLIICCIPQTADMVKIEACFWNMQMVVVLFFWGEKQKTVPSIKNVFFKSPRKVPNHMINCPKVKRCQFLFTSKLHSIITHVTQNILDARQICCQSKACHYGLKSDYCAIFSKLFQTCLNSFLIVLFSNFQPNETFANSLYLLLLCLIFSISISTLHFVFRTCMYF